MSKPPKGDTTSVDTSVPTVPGRNGGRLLAGGKKGHKGAGGRPPDAIRQTLRLAFDQRIKTLQAFADDEALDPQVRMKAVDLLAKYGLGTTFTQTGDDGRAVAAITWQVVKPEAPSPAFTTIRPEVSKHLNGNGHNGSG